MLRRFASSACAALMVAAFAVGSVAWADPPASNANANNCVGQAVSDATKILKATGTNLGQYFIQQGMTPGDAIKAYAERFCGKH